jgi:hypothetical protein
LEPKNGGDEAGCGPNLAKDPLKPQLHTLRNSLVNTVAGKTSRNLHLGLRRFLL